MTGWAAGPLLAVDTETTCADPDYARVVTATLIQLDGPDRSIRKWVLGIREYLIAPDVPISAGAEAVHGISNAHAQAHGRQPEEAIAEIVGEIALRMHRGIPAVLFNGAFDLTVLDRECRRHNIDTLADRLDGRVGPVIDGYVLDRACDTYRKGSRKLVDVAAHYGTDLRNAHTSQADALAAARVAVAIADRYPDQVGGVDLAGLHRQQVMWRAQQCASLAAYFKRQGNPKDVSPDWPVQKLPQSWDPAYHPAETESEVA